MTDEFKFLDVTALDLLPGDVCVTTFGAFTIVGVESLPRRRFRVTWIYTYLATLETTVQSETLASDEIFSRARMLIRDDRE